MSRRTLPLLLLLVAVAAAAIWMRAVRPPAVENGATGVAPSAPAENRSPDEPSRSAEQVQHVRVDDQARVLAPLGARLGRMADLSVVVTMWTSTPRSSWKRPVPAVRRARYAPHVRYVFHTCWHGVDSTVRQCRTQWVDALP